MEKLIEEMPEEFIAKYLDEMHCEDCEFSYSRDEDSGRNLCDVPEDREGYCTPLAKKEIGYILSAVRDGLPLPDEVGRYWVTGGVQPIGGGQVMLPWLDNMAARGATVVIALTGTGKEEEKDGK